MLLVDIDNVYIVFSALQLLGNLNLNYLYIFIYILTYTYITYVTRYLMAE